MSFEPHISYWFGWVAGNAVVGWCWSSARSYLSGEQSDPDLPEIDSLPPDLLDEGTT
jgi:hypothetical protein